MEVFCALAIAGTQAAALQITELVEHKQPIVAGASEVTIVGRSLLFDMDRVDAQDGKVFVASQKLSLKVSNLVGG